jgi:hypothetical protein
MRWPKSETDRSGSTELIAVLISRDPIETDGTYVFHLNNTN